MNTHKFIKNKVTKLKSINKTVNKQIHISKYIYWYEHKSINNNIILVESKSGNDLGGNMFYLLNELQKSDYSNFKIYFVCNKARVKITKLVFKQYNINNVSIVIRSSKKYYKLLASAKFLLNDTAFVEEYIKKDGQIIVNTWHGTPLKKMGRDVYNSNYTYGNVQKNLVAADYLITPSDILIDRVIRPYGVENLSNAQILHSGYPRNSVFFDRESEKNIRTALGYTNKKVYVYMPTWRGTLQKRDSQKLIDQLEYFFMQIDNLLSDDEIFLVKLHPLTGKSIDLSMYKHLHKFPDKYENYAVLNCADCLVTDYSSVFFDYANTRKKIILWAYDNEVYNKDRGLYDDMEKDYPFPLVRDVNSLIKELHCEKNYDDDKFIQKYCSYDNIDAPEKICQKIFLDKNSCDCKPVNNNHLDNVLIYASSIPPNGITSALKYVLANLDNTKRNYFVCFKSNVVSKFPERVNQLPDFVERIPFSARFYKTFKEKVASRLYFKYNFSNKIIEHIVENTFEREAKRFFGAYNYSYSVQYYGYEKALIHLFMKMKGKRTIFVHNDMVSEIDKRNNQHLLTLKKAYNEYDIVAPVTEDIKEPTIEISGTDKNIRIINNCIDYYGTYQKGFGDIEFQNKTSSNTTVKELKKILNSNDEKFINMGRFSPEKGHTLLLDAFEKYNRKYNNSWLIIIGGNGKDYNKTLDYIKTLDCHDKVIVIKNMKNPMPVLRACNLFILSSLYEGLGLVLLEAIINNVPVISTDVRGPRGFMKQYGGHLVELSVDGLLNGMIQFHKGKINHLHIDFEKYNQKATIEFERIFISNSEEEQELLSLKKKKPMVLVRDKKDCCGCGACAQVCPTNSITMMSDNCGFLYPEINYDSCVNCGLCKAKCAFQSGYIQRNEFSPFLAFGARHKNPEVYSKSRSGGTFVAISDIILANNGSIYGADFDYEEGFYKVVHHEAVTEKERNNMCGSKYVQSDLTDIFTRIKKQLESGKLVLFTGTGCQVGALHLYLGKEYENLYTIDLVCHGVPSPKIWRDFLEMREKEKHGKVTAVNFRDKEKYGWKKHCETISINNTEYSEKIYSKLFNKSIFRESCFSCKYTNKKRSGDITIADFWGHTDALGEKWNDDRGISLVMVNTTHGQKLWDIAKNSMDWVDCTDIPINQTNLNRPTKRPAIYDDFWHDYNKNGFEYCIEKYADYKYSE